ncbi:MAG: carbon-nitrogen hydrolase family protein [Anaerolineae bacterium]|nr:carbon-nitrogen hydrolase family protein [Anaerolineae bacterium]
MRILGLQMLVSDNVAENQRSVLRGIQLAKESGADWLVTPEGALSGYRSTFDSREVADAVEGVAAAARDAGVGLMLGTCYKTPDKSRERCYNQVRVYSPDGEYLGYHAKILRCSSLQDPGTGEVAEYAEGALRVFHWGGLCFGVLICNDLWATPGYTTIPNPYLPWHLQQMGAQLIVHAVNTGSDQRYRAFHESSQELWAAALRMPIVCVSAAAQGDGAVNASSGLIGPDGRRVVIAPLQGEQCFVCNITLW